MTQEQLASQLCVQRAVVSKYETGRITPSLEQAQKISAILDIPFLDLIGIEPENNVELERKKLETFIIEHIGRTENFDLNKLLDVYFYDENGLRFRGDNIQIDEFINAYDKLNHEGQQKVLDYVLDLSKIDEYKK